MCAANEHEPQAANKMASAAILFVNLFLPGANTNHDEEEEYQTTDALQTNAHIFCCRSAGNYNRRRVGSDLLRIDVNRSTGNCYPVL
jgi:hypothetical protein